VSSYIGPYGQLVEFKCPSSLEVSAEARSSFETTLGGRVVEQRGPRGRRTWQASLATAMPSQVAGLEALEMGALGPPPWVWVPPNAQSQNLLSPDSSVLMPGTYSTTATPGGSITATDGVFVARTALLPPNDSVILGSRDSLAEGIPVIPGHVITGSVYGSGLGGSLRLIFRDAGGSFLTQPSTPLGADFSRVKVTDVAPEGAVDALVRVYSGSNAARTGAPAATWTTELMPWSIGRGCNRATVDGLSESLQMAVRDAPVMNRSAYQFTVRELG
jgi:hypothetical protein